MAASGGIVKARSGICSALRPTLRPAALFRSQRKTGGHGFRPQTFVPQRFVPQRFDVASAFGAPLRTTAQAARLGLADIQIVPAFRVATRYKWTV